MLRDRDLCPPRHPQANGRGLARWVASSGKADPGVCDRCGTKHDFERLPSSYGYLLGLYLGDGCLSEHPRKVFKLRIFLDTAYPTIIQSAVAAAGEVAGHPAATLTRPRNCVEVYSFWRAWPCLLPSTARAKSTSSQLLSPTGSGG